MAQQNQSLERLFCQLAADAMWGGKHEAPECMRKTESQ